MLRHVELSPRTLREIADQVEKLTQSGITATKIQVGSYEVSIRFSADQHDGRSAFVTSITHVTSASGPYRGDNSPEGALPRR